MNNKILKQKIEYLPGVGPKKSALLNKEIGVYTINDMLHYFPFRYADFYNFLFSLKKIFRHMNFGEKFH